MKNFLQVNRASTGAKKNFYINLNQIKSNPDGEPTVNRQSRLMSYRGNLKNLAMIFAVLMLSIANIGMAWGEDITWTPNTTDIATLCDKTIANITVGSSSNVFKIYAVRGGNPASFTYDDTEKALKFNDNSFYKPGVAVYIPSTSNTVTSIKFYLKTTNTNRGPKYGVLESVGLTSDPGSGLTKQTLTTSYAAYNPFDASITTGKYYAYGGKFDGSGEVYLQKIVVTFSASCEELAAPTGLACVDQSYNTMSFSWDAVVNASSYDVKLWTNSTCTGDPAKSANTTNTTCRIRDLSSSTTYYCKVQTKGDGSTYCTSGGTTATAASGTTDSETRVFKSGETVFFKDADNNIGTLNRLWVIDGGNVYAYFYNSNDDKNWASGAGTVVRESHHYGNAIYKFTVPKNSSGEDHEWSYVIFTRGTAATWDSGFWNQTQQQSPNQGENMFTISKSNPDGSGYYSGSWSTYANGAAVVGDMNNWRPDGGEFVYSGSTGTVYMDLEANTEYKFKVLDGTGWKGCAGTITNTTTSWWGFSSGGEDCTVRTGEEGNYAFKWDNSGDTKYLGIYYPQARLKKGEYIYFDARDNSTWTASDFDARFWFKYYDSNANYPDDVTYHDCAKSNAKDSWVYPYVVPNSDYIGQVQMNRMVSGSWNASADKIEAHTRTSSKQNCIKLNSSDASTSWTTYCPPMSSATLSDNGTTKTAIGSGTEDSPYIVVTGTTIKVSAEAESAIDDDNMTAKYNFKVGGSSQQNSTTTTYTHEASTNNTVYAMSVSAYNNYNSTDGTAANSNVIYYKALDSYTISYSAGGEDGVTGSHDSDTKYYGIDLTLPGVVFSKTGYTQTGWATSKGGDKAYNLSITNYSGNADATLYPVWTANTINVTLAMGTNGAANQAATINYDATTCASFTAVSGNTGYRCTGYYDGETQVLNADGSFAADNVTGYITSGKWTKASNCTLTAHWEGIPYSITYKDGGNTEFSGTHETGYPTSHTYGSATALKKATKTGYAFAGWYTASGCTGDAVTSLGATAYTANITLYARWVELDLHEPGVYEAPTSEGGYGRVLKHATVNAEEHDYEVYLFTIENSKGSIYAGPKTSISDGKAMFTEVATNTEAQPSDTWFSFRANTYEGSEATVGVGEFSQLTSTTAIGDSRYAMFKASSYLRLRVSGYSEFAFIGRDNNIADSKLFRVRIDGVTQDYTHNVTDRTVFRFDLGDTGEHFIEITTTTDNSNRFRGFSLQLPDVTRYTVSAARNNDSYGSLSASSVANVRSGSTLYVDDNTFTVNGTTVTATPESSCSFVNWTVGGSTPPSTVTGNITMMANFSQSFSVTYNKNGATDGTAPSDATEYESGDKVTVKDTTGCNFVYSGYVFRGWNTENDGSGDFYAPGDKFEISSNTTLYAVWVAGTAGTVTYNLTLNSTNTSLDNCASATPTSGDLTASTDITAYGTAGAASSQGNSGKENETQKLKIDATYTAANYYEWTCAIASGKTFTPSQVEMKFQAVSDLTQYKIVLTDGTTSYDSAFVQTTSTGNTLETLTWNIAEGDAFAASSTMRLKLWAFKKNNDATAFRLGTPITIKGVVGTAAAADYTLTWDLAGGTVTTAGTGAAVDATGTPSSSVAYGSPITAPVVAKDGYSFAGWDVTPASTMPATDVTYTAQWSLSYSVTLNANGGAINSGNVTSYTYGVGATLPTDVTKSGYLFQGWYDNSGFSGDAVTTISSSATGNKTFYAKWYELAEKCETTNSTFADAVWTDNYVNGIRYDIEGTDGDQFEMGDGHYFHLFIGDLGTIKEIKLTITAVGTISASTGIDYDFLESNEYAYYDFGDHTEDVTAERSLSTGTLSLRPTSGENNDFAFKTNGTTLTISNICIYYEPAYFTVTYNANGGSSAPSDDTGTDITLNSGSGMTAPSGYTFAGWNTNATGTATGYAGGTTSINADLDLYAIWKPTTACADGYSHVYSYYDSRRLVNGKRYNAIETTTWGSISAGTSLPYTAISGLTSVVLTKGCQAEDKIEAGYPWINSYIKVDKKSSTEGAGITITVASGYIGKLKIRAGGYSGNASIWNNGTKVVDATSGYATSQNAFTEQTIDLLTGANLIQFDGNNAYVSHIDVKLTQLYTLTLDKNNSDASGSSAGSAYVEPNGTSFISGFTASTRTGYAVTGYYAEAECTTLVADAEGNLEANVTVSAVDWTDGDGKWIKGSGATLYAKWVVVYTVTFNTNGGSSVDAITQASEGASITMPAAPTKDGYTFNGWQIGSTYAAGASYTPTANVTAYATWKAECGVIKWDFTGYTEDDISLTEGASTEYTADDGATKMRYTAGSGDKIIAPNKGKLGYFKENGTTSSGSYKDTDGETAIGKNRLIRLFVAPGSGTLRINCNGTNGVYKVLDGSASGTTLISSLSANTTSSSITLTTSPLWIETTTKGYINDIRWTPSSTVCYYVTYNGNGADGGYVNDSEAHSSGDNVTTLANSFTRTGCTFTGWNTAADGSGTAYVAGGTISSISGNVTLYAQWKITVSENKNLSEYASTALATTDVVVTNGATLTVTEDTEVRNITVETGSTLNVNTTNGDGTGDGVTLTVHSLSLKGGLNSSCTAYDMPRVYINSKSSLEKSESTVNFDISVDQRNYYPIAVPFPVEVAEVDYVNSTMATYSIYGKHFVIKEYDGASRAENGAIDDNWVVVSNTAGTKLLPGKGYILTAISKPAYGGGVIRFPMSFTDAWTTKGEQATVSAVTKNTVAVEAYEGTATEGGKNSNKGWNMLGVPYMSCFASKGNYAHDEEGGFIKGKLNFITGEYTETSSVYVTVPTSDFSEYLQFNFDDADTKLLPGWCFFVQVDKDGTITFEDDGQTNSSSLPIYAPKREQEMPTVKTGIILSSETASDKTTILVSDKYSVTDYEINADLEKMFGNGYTLATYSLAGTTRLAYNAMSNSDATNVIPIGYRAPADGEYTFAINPRYAENGAFEHVNLIDYETGFVTDLLVSSYSFATERTQNDERFALNVVKRQDVITDVTVTGDGLQVTGPQKVIINDKLYIIVDGRMYDAKGVMVK